MAQHEADGAQVDGRQGPAQAAGHQGGPQERAGHRRRQEAAPLPARHGGPARDPPLPEVHRAADPQAAVPAAGARDRAGLQDRPALPEFGRDGAAGGVRGLLGGALRGHQPVRHPRQARHHHAQGHPAGARASAGSGPEPQGLTVSL
ncbi:histone H3.1 [Prionailurus iriomotensis]